MHESVASIAFHALSFSTTLAILGLILKQHKVWTRIKDRLDNLWADYCKAHGINFKPIENGKSE